MLIPEFRLSVPPFASNATLATWYQPGPALFVNGAAGRCAQLLSDLRQARGKVLAGQVIFNKVKKLRGAG